MVRKWLLNAIPLPTNGQKLGQLGPGVTRVLLAVAQLGPVSHYSEPLLHFPLFPLAPLRAHSSAQHSLTPSLSFILSLSFSLPLSLSCTHTLTHTHTRT